MRNELMSFPYQIPQDVSHNPVPYSCTFGSPSLLCLTFFRSPFVPCLSSWCPCFSPSLPIYASLFYKILPDTSSCRRWETGSSVLYHFCFPTGKAPCWSSVSWWLFSSISWWPSRLIFLLSLSPFPFSTVWISLSLCQLLVGEHLSQKPGIVHGVTSGSLCYCSSSQRKRR